MKTPLFYGEDWIEPAAFVCQQHACGFSSFKLKIFIQIHRQSPNVFFLSLLNETKQLSKMEKYSFSLHLFAIFYFSMRFIRKLNPLNLKNIALSFGSFNRMNYGQTNWNDNNLMFDINPNSTRKLTSFSIWKMGSSLNRVGIWEGKLRRYNTDIRIRYVKWDFRGYKIVINHQTNTHTHPRTYPISISTHTK